MTTEDLHFLVELGLIVVLISAASYVFSRSGREANYMVPTSPAWDVGTSIVGLVLGLVLVAAAATALALVSTNVTPAVAATGGVVIGLALLALLARPATRRWRLDTDLIEDRRRKRQQARRSRRARHRRPRTYWD